MVILDGGIVIERTVTTEPDTKIKG